MNTLDPRHLMAETRRLYTLAQDEGAFQIDKINKGGYRRYFVGQSLEDLKRQIP